MQDSQPAFVTQKSAQPMGEKKNVTATQSEGPSLIFAQGYSPTALWLYDLPTGTRFVPRNQEQWIEMVQLGATSVVISLFDLRFTWNFVIRRSQEAALSFYFLSHHLISPWHYHLTTLRSNKSSDCLSVYKVFLGRNPSSNNNKPWNQSQQLSCLWHSSVRS